MKPDFSSAGWSKVGGKFSVSRPVRCHRWNRGVHRNSHRQKKKRVRNPLVVQGWLKSYAIRSVMRMIATLLVLFVATS